LTVSPDPSPGRQRARPAGRARARDIPTVEQIVAVETPREFRLNPRDRSVAFTAEVAGARQLLTMPLRGGYPTQVTASEKPVTDPQWAPDGRRLAFVRDKAIWMVDADGSRLTRAIEHPAGTSMPRWSPDGRRLAFVSRRRGWSQVWLIDAPVPRRGRPSATIALPEPRALTLAGVDVEDLEWSPDGNRMAVAAQRGPDLNTYQIHVVDVRSGEERQVAGQSAWETGPRWLPDGGLLFESDADGWFQVVRLEPDLTTRHVLTSGPREHGEPAGTSGFAALPAPDSRSFVYLEVHDGLVDLLVATLEPGGGRSRRSAKAPREGGTESGAAINPWSGVWRAVDWLPDASAVLAIGESEREPQDLWLLPVPGAKGGPGGPARPRRLTSSRPGVLAPAFDGPSFVSGQRVAITARDGLRIEGTLWRPRAATGRRGAERIPAIVYPHGGPTWQAYRLWMPFKQVLVREGFAVFDVDFRGSTGYGRAFRQANHDEWGHADVFDLVDAARWLQDQAWCDGRLGLWGGSYGGYMVLCALVEEPSIWRAGVDLYGDSEIAESYRHGDRIGRLDLQRQMGSPDEAERAELYRRGSPVYRAERIEAPLLILHGRKDRRVVPLMTEKMVEVLEIEGKHHEVIWYDEEGHGWEKRETRRDAFTKILAFLKRHVMDEEPDAPG
jgi:dipeptidyl aminopeptidase/acylaminoacyl peptidase